MQLINLQHRQGNTAIHIGKDLINNGFISQQCADLAEQFIIISDSGVTDLYANTLLRQLQQLEKSCILIEVPAGEVSKTRAMKQSIEDQMLQARCGRDAVMIAVGGGVVTDLAGFVAATYCRGIPSVYVPTTLLAMVDAAIGGKTGVNTPQGKNLIGCFYQPHSVFCDIQTLNTLNSDELANGMVESLKHALIFDADFFYTIDRMLDDISRDVKWSDELMIAFIKKSCQIKCNIVMQDEQEKEGVRQLLNYGHTVGHAIECELAYSISHGQAVWGGVWVASCMANQLGYLRDDDFNQIKHTLHKIQYSQPIDLLPNQIDSLRHHMLMDKKTTRQQARFILLDRIGQAHMNNHEYCLTVDDDVVEYALKLWFEELTCLHY